MSKAKELRTAPENNINMFELLSLFSPEKKSKYTETLIRLMKKTPNFSNHVKEIKEEIRKEYPFIDKSEIDEMPDLTVVYFYRFIDNMFNKKDLIDFRKFCEYNERGIIKQNDLSTYKSFDEVFNAMSLADMVAQTKEMEKQINIVYENDEWLILRPLTFEASKKYGANTKWCTTQENNPEYYHKYSKKGVLCYIINKVTGYKVASFYSLDKHEPEFSWWNQKDSRIDSLEAQINNDIREIIFKTSTENAVTNQSLIEKGDKKKSIPKKLENRIARAVERVQNENELPDPSYIYAQPEMSSSEYEQPFAEEIREEANYESEDGPTISYRPEESESTIDRMTLLSSFPRSQSTFETE